MPHDDREPRIPPRQPLPIRYPRRPNTLPTQGRTRNVPLNNPKREERQITEGQKKVRFSFEPGLNSLSDQPGFQFFSPEDDFIAIDSADDIIQEYVVPSSGGDYGQHTLTKYFVDPVNKILVVYHFNHQENKWIRTTTRLRKDLPIPRPPVGQFNHFAQHVFGSRGQRYERDKQTVQRIDRRQSRANRIWRGRSGTSGARGSTGFRRGR